MGILKVIEWKDNSSNTIVHKIDLKKDYITKGSKLIVRESQVAIFADKGKMADVFLPGTYNLDTDNVPLLTKLLSWKYGFESPFKSDVFFVNTKQFTGFRWGTVNPIMIRDAEFGPVRVRGYGTYAFKVDDAYVFMKELSGSGKSYQTDDITEYLRSIIIMGISDAVAESNIPVLDMAGNLIELSDVVKNSLSGKLGEIGIKITQFNFENFSLPENLEKALDKQTELGMMRQNMDVYTQMAQADALKEAAKNPGMAGGMMGAGIGWGLGSNMGRAFSNQVNQSVSSSKDEETVVCQNCKAKIKKDAKFCLECGAPTQNLCPACKKPVAKGAKFCSECGKPLIKTCAKCGAKLDNFAKFCVECGEKVD